MSKRHNEHVSISDALKEFVEINRLQSGLDQINISDAWVSVMGNGVNSYTNGLKLERNTLYVKLSSSVLREELSYGKEKIINMLNEAMGKDLVKKIILK